MTEYFTYNGITYRREKVPGMNCVGCLLSYKSKGDGLLLCKLDLNIFSKCVIKGTMTESYIITSKSIGNKKIKVV